MKGSELNNSQGNCIFVQINFDSFNMGTISVMPSNSSISYNLHHVSGPAGHPFCIFLFEKEEKVFDHIVAIV